jgi:2-polyprenyl-3-methyl-5-hydroxy-6-metoxy-1,4-benzoquinol methylase
MIGEQKHQMLGLPHKYEYTVDLKDDTAPARIVRLIGREKKVLEIGAGPGSITRILRDQGRCQVTAIEVDPRAIAKLSKCCDRVYQVDLNDATWANHISHEGRFDVVLAADVLEHLYDPLGVLTTMKGLVNARGCLIVSLPHVGHSAIVACLLAENFEYRDWGLLDRTHIRFFGMKNMQALFDQAGLKIIHAEFVVRPPETTEFAEQWAQMSESVRVAVATNPFGDVYQVVIQAIPKGCDGDPISLCSVAVNSSVRSGAVQRSTLVGKCGTAIKVWARHHMSTESRMILRRLMRWLHVTV